MFTYLSLCILLSSDHSDFFSGFLVLVFLGFGVFLAFTLVGFGFFLYRELGTLFTLQEM
jgi:hypothetical protein